jgi:negative regulator of flagellin synthesis FlgM
MIDGVSRSGIGRVGNGRNAVEGGAPAAKSGGPTAQRSGGPASMAFELAAAAGPPVDSAKVSAIREAIARGAYPVDADKIAERMLALDLPAER